MLRATSEMSRLRRILIASATAVAVVLGGSLGGALVAPSASAIVPTCTAAVYGAAAAVDPCSGGGGGVSNPYMGGPQEIDFVEGVSNSVQFTAQGTVRSTPLPAGITLSESGLLSGTPAAGTAGRYEISANASYTADPGYYHGFTITISSMPSINDPGALNATLATPFSAQLKAAGSPAPTFTSNVAPPAGLTLTSAGLISGTPTVSGSFPLVITATNQAGSAVRSVTVNVAGVAPQFTSPAATRFGVGAASTFTVTASGTPAAVISTRSTPTLPAGVSLSTANGSVTLSGTPTATGTFTIPLIASNVAGSVNQDLVLTVGRTPVVTSKPVDVTAIAGATATFSAAADGYPTPSVQWQRLVPGGQWASIANATSTTYSFTTAKSDNGNLYRANFIDSSTSTLATTTAAQLTVTWPVTILGPFAGSFTGGVFGSYLVTSDSSPLPTDWFSAGPSWLKVLNNGNGTVTVSGTPPVSSKGSVESLVFSVSNGIGTAASATFVATVNQTPVVTASPTSSTVKPGDTVTLSAIATGSPTPTVQWQRALPAGGFANITGATTSALTFTASTDANGAQYRAIYTNSVGAQTSAAATVRVGLSPYFTSADSAVFEAGVATSYTVSASGTPAPTFSVSTLPAWLTFTPGTDGTATLSGTAPLSAAGTAKITLGATNGFDPSTSQPFTVKVNTPPTFGGSNSDVFLVGESHSFTVSTGAGYPTATALTLSGDLPAGLTFTDNGDGTATIGGTASAGTGRMHTVVVSANAVEGTTAPATRQYNLTVNETPEITSAAAATFEVGTFSIVLVSSTLGYPIGSAILIGGPLPRGLTFSDYGFGNARIQGTPAAGTGGTYSFSVKALNQAGASATQNFTLTVNELPEIVSAATTTFDVGTSGTFNVEATAGFPISTALSSKGDLPSGVTFLDNRDGTATFSGTASAGTGGSYPITVSARAIGGPDAVSTQSFVLVVNELPSFTSANAVTMTAGVPASFTVQTSDGYPVARTLSVVSGEPDWMTFITSADGTATISGTPPATDAGPHRIVFTVDNGLALYAWQAFELTVNAPATFTSANAATFSVGVASSFTVRTAAGFPTATSIARSGILPAGVTFTDNGDGTATIAGTPHAGTGADYALELSARAVDGTTEPTAQAFTLTVNESTSFTSVASARFDRGAESSFTVTTSAGFPVASVLALTGALPAGVRFVDNGDGTATIDGTPTETGIFAVGISATTGAGTVAQSFALTVVTPPVLVDGLDSSFTIGVPSSVTVTSSVGFPAATILTVAGELPGGLTFVDNGDGTATIAGTALAASEGDYPVVVTASNGIDPDATLAGNLSVVVAPVVALPPVLPASGGSLFGVPASTLVGTSFTVVGKGFAPGAPVNVGVYSTPRALGTAVVGTNGEFTLPVTLPTDLTGEHTIVAAGLGLDGEPLYLTTGITIVAAATTSALAATGADAAPALWIALLLGLVGVLLRAGQRRTSATRTR